MDPCSKARVLILAGDGRWAQRLRTEADWLVWADPAEMPVDQQPDVIVVEGDVPVPGYGGPPAGLDPPPAGGEGVVRIGGAAAANVHLASDATPRELALACRLLVQIVRLRRQVRFGREVHSEPVAQVVTDPLTGLPNRRAWEDALGRRLAVVSSPSRRLCVAILDLDHFKRINDAFGHMVGDEVLRASGQAFRDNLRQDDFIAQAWRRRIRPLALDRGPGHGSQRGRSRSREPGGQRESGASAGAWAARGGRRAACAGRSRPAPAFILPRPGPRRSPRRTPCWPWPTLRCAVPSNRGGTARGKSEEEVKR